MQCSVVACNHGALGRVAATGVASGIPHQLDHVGISVGCVLNQEQVLDVEMRQHVNVTIPRTSSQHRDGIRELELPLPAKRRCRAMGTSGPCNPTISTGST